METDQLALMIPILAVLGVCALIFGIVYLKRRERMAMIERGMDPRLYEELRPAKRAPAPYATLKWGLLLTGAGLGLLLSVILVTTCLAGMDDNTKPGVFFGLISIFGGLGLIISFLVEKKSYEKHQQEETSL